MNARVKYLLMRALHVIMALAGLYILLCVLLWNVDVDRLKQRYLVIQQTLFGKASDLEARSIAQALKDVKDITFFKFNHASELNANIVTGVKYSTAEDIAASKPVNQWCYTFIKRDGLDQRVELAAQLSTISPVYFSLDQHAAALQAAGVNPDVLIQAAKTHCEFLTVNPKDDNTGG